MAHFPRAQCHAGHPSQAMTLIWCASLAWASNSDLDMDKMEKEENDSTFTDDQSRPLSALDAATIMDSNLFEVCKQGAAKLRAQ